MAKRATLQATAEGDHPLWRPLLAHGTVVIKVLRPFMQEGEDTAGLFVFGKLVCFETLSGCQEIARVFSRESNQQCLLFIMIA